MKLIKGRKSGQDLMTHTDVRRPFNSIQAWRYPESVHILINGEQVNLTRKSADKLLRYLLERKS